MAIGVDIGGSGVRAARLDKGLLGPIRHIPLPDRSVRSVLAAVDDAVRGLGHDPVGVGMPAWIDQGVVLGSPHFPDFEDVDLEVDLMERLSRRVKIANDTKCAALGVARELDLSSAVVLTLGAGVGGGVVLEGGLLPVRIGGEFGHMPVLGDRICSCGARGCLEAYCGGEALLRTATEEGLAATSVEALSVSEDPAAMAIWHDAADALGRGLVTLVNLFGPDALVLVGVGTGARTHLREAEHRVRREAIPPHRLVPIHWLDHADRYGIRGAAELLNQGRHLDESSLL